MSEGLMVVEKIGGGGSQDAPSIIQNAERFAATPDLTTVAFSGPGGRLGRATDRMIAIVGQHDSNEDYADILVEVEEQLTTIAEGVGNISLADTAMIDIRQGLEEGYGYHWVKARPEYFARSAYNHVLREAGVETHLINPVRSMYVGANGQLNMDRTIPGVLREIRPGVLNLAVGFAARRPDATIDNLSRGSTDLVGAALSVALWHGNPDKTVRYILRKDDVMGILRASPRIVPDAEVADQLSMDVVEALALGGSEVVHADVLKLIEKTWANRHGVLMDVRNTFDVTHPGTSIVPLSHRNIDKRYLVSGIASQTVDAYRWADPVANNRPGPVAEVSHVFAEHGVSIADIQTSQTGAILAYVPSATARKHAQMTGDLSKVGEGSADVMVSQAQELIVIVGDGLREPGGWGDVLHRIGALAAEHSVRLGSLSHLDGDPNISFTVPAPDAPDFIRTLYQDFFEAA